MLYNHILRYKFKVVHLLTAFCHYLEMNLVPSSFGCQERESTKMSVAVVG